MTEEDVKLKLITPSLQKSGWNIQNQINMEFPVKQNYQFTDGEMQFNGNKISRAEPKRADYLLSYQNGFPLAILEAKNDEKSINDGISQAMDCAKKLDIKFAYSSNGSGFVEYDFFTQQTRILKMNEFPTPNELFNRYKNAKQITPQIEQIIKTPFDLEKQEPRYYQQIAINRTIEAIAKGQKRLLLVMATGTGKTFTAYQIINKLYKSKKFKKILYLADRNILIDQSIDGDFKPLGKYVDKIKKHKINASEYDIFFGLYQQLAGNSEEDYFATHYKDIPSDFFDFIIIDECHRGSANETSAWRKILDYFSSATQLGLTATPKHDESGSNLEYFGNPIYEYSLKQGIQDGFLAPYKVVRYISNIDDGIEIKEGEIDIIGQEIPSGTYIPADFGRTIFIKERTAMVAKAITNFLKYTLKDRYAKTIVFCETTEEANLMRLALNCENKDITENNPNYIVRITGDDTIGKALLDDFINVKRKYPVIATTSQLLSTGVDTKLAKVIVLNKIINSMTEFKQIVGRGTRLDEKRNKKYFTVIDFKGSSEKFNDPEFDGSVEIIEIPPKLEISEPNKNPNPTSPMNFPPQPTPEPDPDPSGKKRFYIKGVEVTIDTQINQIYINGKPVTVNFVDFSKNNMLENFSNLEEFLSVWNASSKKLELLDEFEEKGIFIKELRSYPQYENMDEFDILISLAYGLNPISRSQRAKKANEILNKYQGEARQILEILLKKYEQNGINELESFEIFKTDPFNYLNNEPIKEIFGDIKSYKIAINDIKTALYAL